MSLRSDTGILGRFVLRTGSVPGSSSRTAPRVDGEPDDAWCRKTLTRLFDYLQRLIDVVVANPDGFNDYVAHNLPYQQRIGVLHKRNLTA